MNTYHRQIEDRYNIISLVPRSLWVRPETKETNNLMSLETHKNKQCTERVGPINLERQGSLKTSPGNTPTPILVLLLHQRNLPVRYQRFSNYFIPSTRWLLTSYLPNVTSCVLPLAFSTQLNHSRINEVIFKLAMLIFRRNNIIPLLLVNIVVEASYAYI